MDIIVNPPAAQWEALCARNIPDDSDIEKSVSKIVENVKNNGDKALWEYARKFDCYSGESLFVSEEEMQAAVNAVRPEVADAIRKAAANIRKFHEAQLPSTVEVETIPGVKCMQRAVPIQSVGLYVPGGRAPLFSTVLMLGIPAGIAGCRHITLATPCGPDGIAPETLFAANECGIHTILKVGGAQAITALAYGTESVNRVDKIFGPGNRFVTKAKQMVSNVCAIDMPAGPSEVMVMADDTANPSFVAADLLSQAEHGPDSQAIALTSDIHIAQRILDETNRLASMLPRGKEIAGSLSKSRIIVLPHLDVMIRFANTYAPEHLILSVRNPWKIAGDITAAGSVFIGNYSPESAGDYASGTNHTLPTSAWARAYSGVNIDSYMHKITYQELTPEGLKSLAPVITTMAKAEGLDAHALAASIRL